MTGNITALNDRCILADEIGDRHYNSMRPLKWKCTNECRLLTNRSCIGDKGTISKMHRRCLSWAGQQWRGGRGGQLPPSRP